MTYVSILYFLPSTSVPKTLSGVLFKENFLVPLTKYLYDPLTVYVPVILAWTIGTPVSFCASCKLLLLAIAISLYESKSSSVQFTISVGAVIVLSVSSVAVT